MNKIFEHFKLITKHKWYVFKHCCKAHLFWQGLTHDLSKYSPVEFINGVKCFVIITIKTTKNIYVIIICRATYTI